jgi:hypothetical protein
MKTTDVAWAAGLFEGEGCISVQPSRGSKVALYLGSKDHDVVHRFHELFGGNLTVRKTQNFLMWYTGRKSVVVGVLTKLLPYLGKRRAEKAQAALQIFS